MYYNRAEIMEKSCEMIKLLQLPEGTRKKKKQLSFEPHNLSESNMLIKDLYKMIEDDNLVIPPRSGHIGNWNDIMDGLVRERNDNTIICGQRKLGFPLIYDLTQTENESLDAGDLTYFPGSVIEQGQRTLLPLYTWNGTEFVETNREEALFVPFTFTLVNGKLKSLNQFHYERYQRYTDKHFTMYSQSICENIDKVRATLEVLFNSILNMEEPEHEFKFIVNRAVRLDGVIVRDGIHISDDKLIVGDSVYDSKEELIEAILFAYRAANAEVFREEVKSLPDFIPLLSNHMTIILEFMFCRKFQMYEFKTLGADNTGILHFEWGGIEMAGYAPKELGYFHRQIKYIRRIYNVIYENLDNIPQVHYILLPSSMFLIWPNDEYPEDINSVNNLIKMVRQEIAVEETKDAKKLYTKICETVELWAKGDNQVSELFKKRFSDKKPPIYSANSHARKNEFLEPEEFEELTVQQATMIVSALYEHYQNKDIEGEENA